MSRQPRLARRRSFHLPLITPSNESLAFAEDALFFSADGVTHQAFVEVVLAGPIDPSTGMILDVRQVDQTLAEVLDAFANEAPDPAYPERWAERMFQALDHKFASVSLEKVRLQLDADTWVDVCR